MWRYVVRRLVQAVPVLIGLTLAVFLVMRVIPGDAATVMLQENPTVQHRAELRKQLGLDRSLPQQYLLWVGGLVTGDLGTSFWTNGPVSQEIRRTAPVTIELALLASTIAVVVAVPIGIVSAVKQDSIWDYLGRSLSIGALSVPSFWLGTLAIVLPAIWFNWAPPVVYRPIWEAPLHNLGQFWIPALVIGVSTSGTLMRMTRSSLLEVLRQDYVRTARAKGLPGRLVVSRHMLRNAMIPVITLFGALIGALLTGAVITETIFNLPGFGSLTIDAITKRDYPQIQANVLMFGVVYVLVNLCIDLSYAVLDPRIRYA